MYTHVTSQSQSMWQFVCNSNSVFSFFLWHSTFSKARMCGQPGSFLSVISCMTFPRPPELQAQASSLLFLTVVFCSSTPGLMSPLLSWELRFTLYRSMWQMLWSPTSQSFLLFNRIPIQFRHLPASLPWSWASAGWGSSPGSHRQGPAGPVSLSLSRWPQPPAGDLFSSRYAITLAILRGGLLRGCMRKVSSFSKKQDSKNKEEAVPSSSGWVVSAWHLAPSITGVGSSGGHEAHGWLLALLLSYMGNLLSVT